MKLLHLPVKQNIDIEIQYWLHLSFSCRDIIRMCPSEDDEDEHI